MSTELSVSSSQGFTLLELILVIVIVSVLAVTFINSFDIRDTKRQGFYEQALAAARYAHKSAVASGCDTRFLLDNSGFSLHQRAGCTGAAAFTEAAPDSSAVTSGATVIFDALGRPDSAATIVIAGRSFTIEAETGFVHP